MSNYVNVAETIVSAVLLKSETKHYDVKLTFNGKNYYIIPVTTHAGEKSITHYDFSRLPDLTDEQSEQLMAKIAEVIDDFSLEKSKHIRDNKDEINHFYEGLKFFDDALKESKNIPTDEEFEECRENLAMSVRQDIAKAVPDKDFDKFRYFFLLDNPTFEEMASVLRDLLEYKQLNK
jgi:hypothetical protein